MHRIRSYARLASFLTLLLVPTALAAQETGRIVGRIVEAGQGAPIAGAQVQITGTDIHTVSAIDGRYTLQNVPVGQVSISARMLGYAPKTVTGLVVTSKDVVEQNISLATSVVQLEEVAVTAEAEKGSINSALDTQKNSISVVNAISAEQIEKTPDSDAGAAVQRVSGVSVEDGKYVIVRGLGERYTTTALNGAVIPSAETDRKVVPLDLFPTNLLEGITTSKTFTPDQPGDFSGARVDLKTKEFPAGRQINIGITAGFNTAVTGQNIAQAPTVSGDWFGNGAGPRALPSDVAAAGDLTGTNQSQLNTLIGSFRNVWAPNQGDGNGAGGFNASIGGEDPVFGHMLGYLASFSYAYAQEIRTDQTKGVTKRGDEVGTALPLNQYSGSSASGSVLWGGMLNFSTRLGASSKFDFNNTYTRGADNSVEDLSGFNEEFAQDFAFSRLTYIQRSVRTNQLVGNHLIGQRNYLTWQVATSGVTRDEPDRSDIGYQARATGPDSVLAPYQWFGQTRFATRTWSTLNQSNWDLGANWQHSFGALNRPWNVKGGAAWRTASREVDVRAYDIVNQTLDQSQLQQAPEQIFSQANIDNSSFFMQANANGGRYDASEDVYAGYVQVEFPLTTRLQLVGGARLESWTVNVASVTTTGAVVNANPSKTDILPSLGLNYALTQDQNLRFAATQTVSRPEYRELSPIAYFEQVGFAVTQGNPSLNRALIQNVDLRWEWYPRGGEILSAGVFYKHFDSPIEKVYIQSAGANILSYVNAEGADNYGLELEARKNLDFAGSFMRAFTAFANVTLMKSSITVGNDSISAATNPVRPMVGQSPYIVNAGLLWTQKAWAASLLYNVQGQRILEAGTGGIPDAYEKPRSMLDATVQIPILRNLTAKVEARNLLNARYLFEQGGVVRQAYYSGRIFGVGFKWEL